MKIHQGITDLPKINFAVVTSGMFDGVHFGHQKILRRVVEIAKSQNGESVVLTFWPHPRYILSSASEELKLLTTIDEKIELLAQNGIDHLVMIPFTKEFSQLSSESFVKEFLVEKLGTRKLVIGYDHRFGKNREGSFEYLMENEDKYGFQVEEIPEQDIHEVAVSSTKIRTALEEGNIQIANEFLGRLYSIKGKIVEGDKIGRTLGYPTANLAIEESYKLIPRQGIYAVLVECKGKTFKGMTYIGNRPTIGNNKKSIETFIFDFNDNIYDELLKVSFIEYLREDIKFDSLTALIEQMNQDKQKAQVVFNKLNY